MPEMLEVEMYRRALDEVVGGRITSVEVADPAVVRGGEGSRSFVGRLTGARITGTRRHGKLLLMDSDGSVVGWHFGMTGRLTVDGQGPIDALAYGPAAGRGDDGRWDRLLVGVKVGRRVRTVRFTDPRRFGWVGIDPPTGHLGPDAWTARRDDVAVALGSRRAPVKAVLLDQQRLAGLGNLLVDELLWRTRIDPARAAGSLSAAEISRLHAAIAPMLDELYERGGSHVGDIDVHLRRAGGTCPIDGTPLRRRSIGGRTTWSCPRHQR